MNRITHHGTPDREHTLALAELVQHVQSGDATGYQVHLARRGQDALDALETDEPLARYHARQLFCGDTGVMTWREDYRCNCGQTWTTGEKTRHTSEAYGTDHAKPCPGW